MNEIVLILLGIGVLSLVIFLIFLLGPFSIIPLVIIALSGIAGWKYEGERMKNNDKDK